MHVRITRLDPDVSLPVQGHSDDAGYDLCVREDATVPAGGGRVLVPTGLAVAIPSGYAGLVLSFQTKVPSGPAIILVSAVLYVGSVLFGNVGGLIRQLFPGRHLEA